VVPNVLILEHMPNSLEGGLKGFFDPMPNPLRPMNPVR